MELKGKNLEYFLRYEEVITYSFKGENIIHEGAKKSNKELNDSFWRRFYINRKAIENELLTYLKISGKVISVEGVNGCGKSTIIKKVLKRINTNHYILIDFEEPSNLSLDKKNKSDLEYWKTLIEKNIIEICIARYFDGNEDMKNLLYALALNSEEEIFQRKFKAERAKIDTMDVKFGKIKNINSTEFKENYSKLQKREKAILKGIFYRIYLKADYQHLIRTIKKYNDYKEKFIVILDNIDNLPHQAQPYCYEFAVNFNKSSIQDIASIVICIRMENAHRAKFISNHESEDVEKKFIGNIHLGDHPNNYLEEKDFLEILEVRHIYYKEHYEDKLSKFVDFIFTKIKEIYHYYDLIDLANQSIKMALKYHVSFIRFLIENIKEDHLKEILEDNGKFVSYTFLTSCFLGWAATHNNFLEGRTLNLIKIYFDRKIKKYSEFGCDIDYLILAYLYNALEGKTFEEGGGKIRIGNMIDDFTKIGFKKRSEIKKKIYNLYKYNGKDMGHIIDILEDENIESGDNIEDDTFISLNYRGRCLYEDIVISFTFLNILFFNTGEYWNKSSVNKLEYYDFKNYCLHIRNSIRLYSKIAYLHSLELLLISDMNELGQENWMNFYLNKFGYWHIKYKKYMLHLERIIDLSKDKHLITIRSIFYRKYRNQYEEIVKYISILEKLNELYEKQIELIKENKCGGKIFNFDKFAEKVLYDCEPKQIDEITLENIEIGKKEVSDIISKRKYT